MFNKYYLIYILFLFLSLIFPSRIIAQVSINEFLPDSSQEWIEFYNASDSAEYIKNYFIDDDTDFLSDSGSSARKALTNLDISNPNFPYIEISSFLNNSGDYVVLFNESGLILDQYQYTNNPGRDVSIGRYPDGTGAFFILPYLTRSDANPAPSTPTPTLSPTPTQIAVATNTATPTSTPIKSASAVPNSPNTSTSKATSLSFDKPTTKPYNSQEPVVENILETGTPTSVVLGVSTKRKIPLLSVLFIFVGVLFLGYGGYLIYNKYKYAEKVVEQ